jgi:hypothetical protein
MKRAIYKKLPSGMTVGIDGSEFDAKSEMVRVWDAEETDHVFDMPRAQLVGCETTMIIWTDENGTIIYAG